MRYLHCFYHVVKVLSVMLFCMAVQNCNTILESREECPCVLAIDYGGIGDNVKSVQVWAFDSDKKLIFKDTAERKDFGAPYVSNFKKGEIFCYAWCNIGNATICSERFSSSTTIEKAGALSADSLFFFKYEGVAKGEEMRLHIFPNKEFATVNIKFEGLEKGAWAEADLICRSGGFFIDGACVDGVSLTTVSTLQKRENLSNMEIEAPAQMALSNSSNETVSLRMLRQRTTDGIFMNLYILSGEKEITKKQNGTFELGKYLKEVNYDMRAPNLKDIDLLIDVGAMTVNVNVAGWNITAPVTAEF